MQPIPCAHCGNNFMRITPDPEAPKLCNNCKVREQVKNPKKENEMENVDILIKCPQDLQIEIEEYCINQGMDFTKYFLTLHKDEMIRLSSAPIKQEYFENSEKNSPKQKGIKK